MENKELKDLKYHETINLCLTSNNPDEQINRYIRSEISQAQSSSYKQGVSDTVSKIKILWLEAKNEVRNGGLLRGEDWITVERVFHSKLSELDHLEVSDKEGNKVKCPECNKEMENKGNVSCITYTTYPSQHDDVWVCEKCKTKKTVRVQDAVYTMPDYSDFTEVALQRDKEGEL